ncbi:E3 ubiquitin-protein ligase TRAIP [Ananas comosus]|uniref:E3 ubiquitin-protein ligase TRAIP n=1 Tax=Ananas comosus TaxID=4615 RepID=A0A6P5GZL1_ANACO|nr:E3 ubiquitin-protein ligase TRAIP [Ananas comosus]
MSHRTASQKPICTICYEDLKPVLEDLHSIPVCGHVFHELCLQQWLEYCPAGKKPTCPVCKQSFSHHPPVRLYFQSTGDAAAAATQNPSSEADAEAMAEEVARLELKLSSLTSNFESQNAHIKKLNDEVVAWKELAEKEEARREQIKKEKDGVAQLLNIKLEELSRKSSECVKLQEKSLALAKELAALKLATDLNLGEDEIVKLASLGHGSNPENAVQILKRSLALRNKSYKELMVQCNLLGRAESRAQQKLEKAKEQIKKLKARLQELEKEFEEKENRILRDLKASKKLKPEGINSNFIKQNMCSAHTDLHSSENGTSKNIGAIADSNKPSLIGGKTDHLKRYAKENKAQDDLISSKDNTINDETDLESSFFVDEDDLGLPRKSSESPSSASDSKMLVNLCKAFRSGYDVRDAFGKMEEGNATDTSSMWTKEILLIDDITKQSTSHLANKGIQANEAISCPGANRNIGKWSRTSTMASSLGMQAAKRSGDLIAVGADGRGGRIKVLRSLDRSLEEKVQTLRPKKHKLGANSGQFQIEHFFGKT